MNKSDIKVLQKHLGYHFTNADLLVQALTHASYAYEQRLETTHQDNECLEFLGDGLLDFVIADVLFERRQDKQEGFLSQMRARIVCEPTLCDLAKKLSLGDYLLLGKGEEQTGGRQKSSNLANAVEAVFAAVYLDGGFDVAKKMILELMQPSIERALQGKIIFDYKSKLLEMYPPQKNVNRVTFELVNQEGPVHERIFHIHAFLDHRLVGQGKGPSKKNAEQNAAKDAFDALHEQEDS